MADIVKLDNGYLEVGFEGTERTVKFNPSDSYFLRNLYAMLAKVQEIIAAKQPIINAEKDFLKQFDILNERDKEMRAVVDEMFGDGFCRDLFGLLDLTAVNDKGLMLIEDFAFSLVDRMDESVRAAVAKRESNIAKYTDKYKKKYHK